MRKRRSRRAIYLIAFIALAIAAVLGFKALYNGPLAFAGGSTVALSDYRAANPTGVPAELATADAVKRGEYLARAADCMVCHTAIGGTQYAGGLGIPLPFGTLYSTNITPDKETGIGGYSDQDFINAVKHGVRRDGVNLYPAMPFTSYGYMTDADVLAIKAYLFSLPPVHAANRRDTLAFPYNQRWTMVAWSLMFDTSASFRPNPERSPEWNRGAYIAEALAHCGDCHTPRNLAFALDNRRKFAGAVAAGWRAFNITSEKATGIGDWSDSDLIVYLSTGHASGRGTAAGPMGEAVDQSFSRMAPSDIRALVAYLRSIPAIVSADLPAKLAPPAPPSPKQGGVAAEVAGKRVYESACTGCHGWTGVSEISPFATISGARAVNDRSAINVAQIVISGTTRSTPQGALSMPGFGHVYSDVEIAAVANYVTGRFGSAPSAITATDVAALRSQTAR